MQAAGANATSALTCSSHCSCVQNSLQLVADRTFYLIPCLHQIRSLLNLIQRPSWHRFHLCLSLYQRRCSAAQAEEFVPASLAVQDSALD